MNILPICAITLTLSANASTPTSSFQSLVHGYHMLFLEMKPSYGTWSGLFRFNGTLENYEPAVRATRIHRLEDLQVRCDRINLKTLSVRDRHDLAMIRSGIAEQRFYLEELRLWERDPGLYLSAISNAITELIDQEALPLQLRLRHILQCERRIPALLKSAQANLKTPPRELTELAIESLPDLVTCLERDVPKAFRTVGDTKLQAALAKQSRLSVQALHAFETWLRSALLPRSTGSLALGEAHFRRRLLLSEQVDTPLDRLRAVGLADLRRNQAALEQLAKDLRPGASLKEVLTEAGRNHPSADRLFACLTERIAAARDFVIGRDLATLPRTDLPLVTEIPEFFRSGSQARMKTIGPYVPEGRSCLQITPPDPRWPAEKADAYLSFFNPGKLGNLAVHECFPGHFVMDGWLRREPSMTRRLCMSGTFLEGWAHYAEQMMVEEGFAADDPMLRIGQLVDALLRNARFLVAIGLHTQGMTIQEASTYFQREAFLPKVIAEMEAKRAMTDPDVITYTLGKLQFLKLRDDLRKKQGPSFTLKGFHDAVLGSGVLPVKLLREELLGEIGEDL